MEYYILVFKNTYDAMNAEKILTEKKFNFRIMPTPTSITQSCGICTRFESSQEINRVIEEKIVEFKNAYHRSKQGYEVIK